MKNGCLRIISILVLPILMAGCGRAAAPVATLTLPPSTLVVTSTIAVPQASSTPVATLTPDACSSGQIEASVQKVHRHMREFDDAAALAGNLPRDQLAASVAELQRIRREAEDEQIPACLTNLRKYQVEHMNSVINTVLAFIGGSDATTLEQGLTIARQQHDQYTLELARLLGITVVPATVPVISTPATPARTATP